MLKALKIQGDLGGVGADKKTSRLRLYVPKSLDTSEPFVDQTQKLSGGTQHYYFLRLNRVMRLAMKLEYIDKDPFLHFEMPKDQPVQRLKLSDTQITALENLEVEKVSGETLWLWWAKWFYFFSFRKAGMRAGDISDWRIIRLFTIRKLRSARPTPICLGFWMVMPLTLNLLPRPKKPKCHARWKLHSTIRWRPA